MSSLRFSEKEMAFLILGEPLGFAMQDRYQRPYLVQGGFQSWVKQGIQVKELKPETVLTILNEGFAAASYALLGLHICFLMDRLSITFQEQLPKMLKSSVSGRRPYNLLPSLASVRLGVQAFSCAAGKLENNRIGLPTSPSSSDVQNRGLKAESQPSETKVQNPSPESVTPLNEKVDLSEA
ncbi:hypothetical protein POPTR_019G098950v4 [Populus trichocarpa]|nr:hypothetical protein POPTR_019G098950v4 [Populus trichocarpa]